MKKCFLFCLIIFACGYLSARNSYEKLALTVCQESHSKKYIKADQIFFSEEGILIVLQNIDLVANNIFHDQQGFYYLEDGVLWRCRNCGALNSLDDARCYRCNEPR